MVLGYREAECWVAEAYRVAHACRDVGLRNDMCFRRYMSALWS